jgi:predicted DNA-binding transcriptional regulator AlpA
VRLSDVADLPATFTTDEVAERTGFSRWSLYERKQLELPDGTVVRPIRCGRAHRWPAAPILAALDGANAGPQPTPSPAVAQTPSESESGRRPGAMRPQGITPGAATIDTDLHDQVSGDGTG